jgi:hypothetical protein
MICTDVVRTVKFESSGGQLCDRIFQKFRWKSFLFKSRVRTVRHWSPNGRTSATSNFHIRLRVSGPRGMNVRTTELQHAISISVMRASEPWRAGIQTVDVESAISILVARASGSWYLKVVRTRCWDVRTDASWNRSFSIQCRVRTVWHVVQTVGTVDRWASGRDGSIVRTAGRELEFFWLAGRIFWHHSE